jgi:hypothetical protein
MLLPVPRTSASARKGDTCLGGEKAMSSESTLFPAICEFLDAVALVVALESSEAALIVAARSLWVRLAQADDAACMGSFERISGTLMRIGELRKSIAQEIAIIRTREALQVLGQ